MRKKKINYTIKDAKAARAVMPSVRGELPKISLTFTTYDNEIIEFELDFPTATKMLNEAIAAHSVVAAPLKVPRQNFFG